MQKAQSQFQCQLPLCALQRRQPWHRRVLARIGLQGKLIVSFAFLLLVTLASAHWLFASETRRTVRATTGESAIEIAQTLANVSQRPMQQRDLAELRRIGGDLLKSPGLLLVAFRDPRGGMLAVACQDPDYALHDVEPPWNTRDQTQWLMQVRLRHSPALGDYAQVTAPVLAVGGLPDTHNPLGQETRLVGYVTIGRSTAAGQEYLRRTDLIVVFVGGLMFALSLPLVYVLVRRIFLPIRQLVGATQRIAAGDLQTQVAIHRPDAIGALARSFNEMVRRVQNQQGALATANVKLGQANRDLEQRIHQRTAQLEAANRRLSSEVAEKEEFLRAVSHDLNAPLRNIAGMVAMLLHKHRDEFDVDVVHRLERVQSNVAIESDLIEELLELSRIKTRRQKLESLDLNRLIDEMRGMFDSDLLERQIRLIVDCPLPVLRCERARMRQVFQNLIDNAIKYMGEPSGDTLSQRREIHIGCVVRLTEAELYVRDTGIGIAPDELDKVFRVFRRGRNAVAHHVAGKGVGLASVKSIVETYNGSIWVDSELHQGTTFHFTINGQYVQQASGSPGFNASVRPTAA